MGTHTIHHRTIRAAFAGLALLVLAGGLTGCLNPDQDLAYTRMNADRQAHGLAALPLDARAQAKAQAWADHLARIDDLVHSNLPDGFAGGKWCEIGENIGYGPDPSTIETAYMHSPPHRANILAREWTAVGVGYARRGSKVFTVQDFLETC